MDRERRAQIGRQIRDAREAKGLLMKDAAQLADVPYRTYRSIENGETTGQGANLAKIMDALDISQNDVDEPPIWLELHHGDIPHEVELFAMIAVQDWNRQLAELLDLDETERMAEIRRRVRDWDVADVHTPTPTEIPLSPTEHGDTPAL